MGSGFTNAQGGGQAAIARGRARRETTSIIHAGTSIGAQHAQRSLGVKHYAHGHFSGLQG